MGKEDYWETYLNYMWDTLLDILATNLKIIGFNYVISELKAVSVTSITQIPKGKFYQTSKSCLSAAADQFIVF